MESLHQHNHIFVTHTGIDVRALQYYEQQQQQSLSQMDIGRFVHKMNNFGSIKTNSDPF